MLWFAVAVLIVAWITGLLASYTLGGYIHVLLVMACILVMIHVFRGPEPEIRKRGDGIQPKYRKS